MRKRLRGTDQVVDSLTAIGTTLCAGSLLLLLLFFLLGFLGLHGVNPLSGTIGHQTVMVGSRLVVAIHGVLVEVVVGSENDHLATDLIITCRTRVNMEIRPTCRHASCQRGLDGGCCLFRSQHEDVVDGVGHDGGNSLHDFVVEHIQLLFGRCGDGHIAVIHQGDGHLFHLFVVQAADVAAFHQYQPGVRHKRRRHLRQALDEGCTG